MAPSYSTPLPLQEMRATRVQSLGWQDPLEKGVAALSGILAWAHGQRSLVGYVQRGRKESAAAKQLHNNNSKGQDSESQALKGGGG